MLLSEARPRQYRQPESERKFNQEEIDKEYFDRLKDHAEWNKNYGPYFIGRYRDNFNNSAAVARNPHTTIRSYCRHLIRDMFVPYYEQHASKLVKDPDIHVILSNAYYDSVHVGVTVNTTVDVHRPLEKDIWQDVGEFTVRGYAGDSTITIEKGAYSGSDVIDALFSITQSDAGPQYEKVLKDLMFFAYDDNGKDGFEYERDNIQEDPEVHKLLELMSIEVDKKIKPIIADVSKKLMSLKVYVSQHTRELYKK